MQLDFRKYTPADAPVIRRLVSGPALPLVRLHGRRAAGSGPTITATNSRSRTTRCSSAGRAEDGRPAYLLPVGALPPVQGVAALCGYCRARGEKPLLSFVPQEAAEAVAARIPCRLEQQAGWSDYLYLRQRLAELPGNALHRKRNRVNKFKRDFPDHGFERLGGANLDEAAAFFESLRAAEDRSDARLTYEAGLIAAALGRFSEFGFVGGLLRVGGRPVALTVGDVVGDTLYVHIEKASRAFEGAYEAINALFAASFGDEVVLCQPRGGPRLRGSAAGKRAIAPSG